MEYYGVIYINRSGFMRSLLIAAITLLVAIAASPAFAGNCASPTGSEGQVRYDSTTKALYFCDGTNWKLASRKLCCGNTKTDGTGWVDYNPAGTVVGAYIDVNTSGCAFANPPNYSVTIGGNAGQWALTGTNAIYGATSTGFRVYIRYSDPAATANAAQAAANKWYLQWCGVVDSSINAAGSNGVLY